MDLDTFCQICYPVFWLAGFALVSNYQRRIGFLIAAVSLPMAMYSFYTNELWGSVTVEVVAAVMWFNGMYRAWHVEPERWR